MLEKMDIVSMQVASLVLEWIDRGACRRAFLSELIFTLNEDQQMEITEREDRQHNARINRCLTRPTPLWSINREFHCYVTIQIQTATKPRGEMKSVTRRESSIVIRSSWSFQANLLEEEDMQFAKNCALNVNL